MSETKITKERRSKKTLREQLNAKRAEPKTHSPRFLALEEKVSANKPLSLADAVALIKETANIKFDSSVELHLHLNPKKGKKGAEDEYQRGILHLPHGLGKSRKVVVLSEDLIEELAKTQKIDFDIALASPSLMPKLSRVAKLLGTKGKMPNPKAGTVTDNPDAVKSDIETGKNVEYRQDAGHNIHQMIGKTSWADDQLLDNAKAVLTHFTRNRIKSVSLTSTMGPSVKVNLE